MSNPNPSPSNRFKPGDPRINRKGRPRSFDKLRELARQIANEEAQARDKRSGALAPVIINGHIATTTELILRRWAASNDARLQIAFMEYAFGKVPTQTEVTGADGGPVGVAIIEVVKDHGGAD